VYEIHVERAQQRVAHRGEESTTVEARYVIVMPVRNEAAHLRRTLDSLASQSLAPAECIVVDDGSSDETAAIVEEYAAKLGWLRLIRRGDRGFRKAGGGVMETFYEGFRQIRVADWEYVVKLDGDLEFNGDYFARCLEHFVNNPKLGIGGGQLYTVVNGHKDPEHTPRFHVRGATKIYRRACWEAIGGLKVTIGWDAIDEATANMLGWQTRSFPELEVCHLRPTGTADGLWRSNIRYGEVAYLCGYHPLYMLARCFFRLGSWPYGLCSLGLVWGYTKGFLKRQPPREAPEVRHYVRTQQWRRLIGQSSIWR